MARYEDDEISARVERLLTAQPTAPPEARRVRRPFKVVARREESRRHLALQIEVDREFFQAYRRPGQYVTLKVPGWPARFFVVADCPSQGVWEFLVDRSGELGPILGKLEVGEQLLISLPEGGGFDAVEAAQKTALLFCTGSGVATMRPLIGQWLESETSPSEIAMYYGEHDGRDFAYESLIASWEEAGVEVYRAVEVGGDEKFPHRYVQHAFAAHHPALDDAFAYLSGAPVMIQIVARKLMDRGIDPSRVKINI